MLTALGRRGTRGALAALARASRGGEVWEGEGFVESAIDASFFFASLFHLLDGLVAFFSASIHRDDEETPAPAERERERIGIRARESESSATESKRASEGETTSDGSVDNKCFDLARFPPSSTVR